MTDFDLGVIIKLEETNFCHFLLSIFYCFCWILSVFIWISRFFEYLSERKGYFWLKWQFSIILTLIYLCHVIFCKWMMFKDFINFYEIMLKQMENWTIFFLTIWNHASNLCQTKKIKIYFWIFHRQVVKIKEICVQNFGKLNYRVFVLGENGMLLLILKHLVCIFIYIQWSNCLFCTHCLNFCLVLITTTKYY